MSDAMGDTFAEHRKNKRLLGWILGAFVAFSVEIQSQIFFQLRNYQILIIILLEEIFKFISDSYTIVHKIDKNTITTIILLKFRRSLHISLKLPKFIFINKIIAHKLSINFPHFQLDNFVARKLNLLLSPDLPLATPAFDIWFVTNWITSCSKKSKWKMDYNGWKRNQWKFDEVSTRG